LKQRPGRFDRICDRQFGCLDTPESRYFTAAYDTGRRRWIIDTDDFATTDGLIVEATGPQSDSPITSYLPAPVNAVVNGGVWTAMVINPASPLVPGASEHGVRVTALFGWPEVPPTISLTAVRPQTGPVRRGG
jgi:hypothetical protein